MEVPVDTRVWRERPQTEIPEWKGRGRRPSRRRLEADAPAPQDARERFDLNQQVEAYLGWYPKIESEEVKRWARQGHDLQSTASMAKR